LSRGAAHVVFVESDRRAADAIARTATGWGVEADYTIQVGDAVEWLRRLAHGPRFDLILLDPPFAAGLNDPALKAARRLVAADGLVYLESATELTDEQAASAGFEVVRGARAGRVHFHLLRPRDAGIIASRGPVAGFGE
jgi:16S rRNA G966 N2-methylase RsmD